VTRQRGMGTTRYAYEKHDHGAGWEPIGIDPDTDWRDFEALCPPSMGGGGTPSPGPGPGPGPGPDPDCDSCFDNPNFIGEFDTVDDLPEIDGNPGGGGPGGWLVPDPHPPGWDQCFDCYYYLGTFPSRSNFPAADTDGPEVYNCDTAYASDTDTLWVVCDGTWVEAAGYTQGDPDCGGGGPPSSKRKIQPFAAQCDIALVYEDNGIYMVCDGEWVYAGDAGGGPGDSRLDQYERLGRVRIQLTEDRVAYIDPKYADDGPKGDTSRDYNDLNDLPAGNTHGPFYGGTPKNFVGRGRPDIDSFKYRELFSAPIGSHYLCLDPGGYADYQQGDHEYLPDSDEYGDDTEWVNYGKGKYWNNGAILWVKIGHACASDNEGGGVNPNPDPDTGGQPGKQGPTPKGAWPIGPGALNGIGNPPWGNRESPIWVCVEGDTGTWYYESGIHAHSDEVDYRMRKTDYTFTPWAWNGPPNNGENVHLQNDLSSEDPRLPKGVTKLFVRCVNGSTTFKAIGERDVRGDQGRARCGCFDTDVNPPGKPLAGNHHMFNLPFYPDLHWFFPYDNTIPAWTTPWVPQDIGGDVDKIGSVGYPGPTYAGPEDNIGNKTWMISHQPEWPAHPEPASDYFYGNGSINLWHDGGSTSNCAKLLKQERDASWFLSILGTSADPGMGYLVIMRPNNNDGYGCSCSQIYGGHNSGDGDQDGSAFSINLTGSSLTNVATTKIGGVLAYWPCYMPPVPIETVKDFQGTGKLEGDNLREGEPTQEKPETKKTKKKVKKKDGGCGCPD